MGLIAGTRFGPYEIQSPLGAGGMGMTGCIVGACNAHQGSLIASLGVSVSDEQADAVWAIAARLDESLAAL